MRTTIRILAPAVLASLLTAPAWAQTPAEMGRLEYESNCATCHGITAQGDGPMRAFLVRPPSDLTTLARRNGGVFPRSAIADLIDGRGVPGPGVHGTRDMPVWGRVYREQAEQATRGLPMPPEWSVRGRIIALVDYLQSLQQP
jgi:mono/diheme cytochrome c family protein